MRYTLRSLFLGCCVMLLCLSWGGVSVEASIVLQLSDHQMTLRAGRIVRGKVVRKYSRWIKSERRIYTYITLAVLDMIKGSKQSREIVIRQVGGTANGLGMHVPGSASFKLGEEVLVFLEKPKSSKYHLVMGMSFGKYRVVVNPKTKMKLLQRNLHGVSLARYDVKKKLQINHTSPVLLRPKPLDSFVQRLRGYLVMSTVQRTKPPFRSVVPRVVTPRSTPQRTLPRVAPRTR